MGRIVRGGRWVSVWLALVACEDSSAERERDAEVRDADVRDADARDADARDSSQTDYPVSEFGNCLFPEPRADTPCHARVNCRLSRHVDCFRPGSAPYAVPFYAICSGPGRTWSIVQQGSCPAPTSPDDAGGDDAGN